MVNNDVSSPRRCILYYPTITIPTGRWLRQALLYWDEVASIAPLRRDGNELESLPPDIDDLKKEGEFRPIRPDELIHRGDYHRVREIEEEFKAVFLSPGFQRLLPPEPRELSSKIYEDKISMELFSFLEAEHVATLSQQEFGWYRFEVTTALLYMSILAKHIAETDVNYTIPGTDRVEYEHLIFHAMSRREAFPCLKVSLWDILPTPRDDVSLSEIVTFKRKRRSELLKFRQFLDDFESSLKRCETKQEVNHVAVKYKEDLGLGVADLRAVLRDSRLAVIAGSSQALVKVDSPALLMTIGAALGQATSIVDIPLSWSAGGIAIAGALQIGKVLVDKRNERNAAIRASSFSYLMRATRRMIIP